MVERNVRNVVLPHGVHWVWKKTQRRNGKAQCSQYCFLTLGVPVV